MMKSSRWVWSVVVAAVAIRLLHAAAMSGTPFFAHPGLDAEWHIEWARRILAGTDPATPYFRTPGYVLFLTAVFRIFGAGPWPIHIVQALLGGATTWLVYRLARRFHGRPASLTAAIMAAFYGPLIYFDGELLATALALPLFLTALIAAARARSGRDWLLAGFVFGAGAAVLPTVLSVVVALAGALMIGTLRPQGAPRSRPGLTQASALVLGALLAIAPIVARNGLVAGDWTLASSGGVNFYAGNNASASGLSVVLPEFETQPGWREFVPRTEMFASVELGHPLKPSEVSAFYVRRGIAFWTGRPVQALGLQLRKFYYVLNGHAHPNNRDLYTTRRLSPVLALLLWHFGPFHFPFGLVLPLAGLALFRPGAGRARILILYLVAYGLAVTLFFVTERYRLPLIPVLLIFAAAGLHQFLRAPLAMDKGTVAALLLAFAANSHFLAAGASNPTQEQLRLGEAYFDGGQYEEAAEIFRSAAEGRPGSPEGWSRLGGALAASGRSAEALAAWERAAAAGSRDPLLWFNIGTTRLDQNRPGEAVKDLAESVRLDDTRAEVWVNLGVAYGRMGDRGGALEALDRALRLDPGQPQALAEKGRWLAVSGDPAGARTAWTSALSRDSMSVEIRLNLGVLDFDSGRLEEAERWIREARRVAPQNGVACFHLARIAAVRKDAAAVVLHLGEALSRGFAIRRPILEDPVFSPYRELPELETLLKQGGDQEK